MLQLRKTLNVFVIKKCERCTGPVRTEKTFRWKSFCLRARCESGAFETRIYLPSSGFFSVKSASRTFSSPSFGGVCDWACS